MDFPVAFGPAFSAQKTTRIFPIPMTEETSAETTENQNKKVEKQYNADDLRTMKGLEAVREKPGMYIGGTDERALHHCVNRGARQFGGRISRRALHAHRCDHPQRRLDFHPGQRARHPGGHQQGGRTAGRRARAHAAALGRQVRAGKLRIFRRHARRRREVRERGQRVVQGRGDARREDSRDVL